ncbi:hypothetical protein WKK05_29215 [Nostoc sp. UHCC 0302]|uniref:hypothetical protein n=1 Tax=Nostoc sp. UHCC 0302 TaxID=3134896 RepID=UPI00311CB7CD
MAKIIISNLYTSSEENLLTDLESWELKSVEGGYRIRTTTPNSSNTAVNTSTIRDTVSSTLDQVDSLLGDLRIQIDQAMSNLQNQVAQQTTS